MILCGGGGTRLWPLSTPRKPKQFLNLIGARSMLAETAARVDDPARFSKPLAIGAARHAHLLRDTLPNADILLEPIGRNSAPPIAAACLLGESDDLMVVLPADHFIADLQAFHAAIETGVSSAMAGRLVTFGIEPDHPAIGYGYIEAAGFGPVRPVTKFHEKPSREEAERYLEAGGFYWNAGIFLFRAGDMIDAFAEFAPDILDAVTKALTPDGLDPEKFSAVRSESIDYAVLERAERIDVVPVEMGWSDLGDFRALHAAGVTASVVPGNVVSQGHVSTTETTNAYIRAEGLRVAVHGLDDVAVVATPESVLVTRLSDAAGIKPVAGAIQNPGFGAVREDQRNWLGDWLWGSVLPAWAKLAVDPVQGGFVENINLDGTLRVCETRRGRIAPRQLFAFARARRLGWNPNGAADVIIDAALDFLTNRGRAPGGGWAHKFNGDGTIQEGNRDLYDHAFVALAGSELALLGDERGIALANEAFKVIDTLFLDPTHGGWRDPETAPNLKRANPHMHLLEASLAHYEALHDPVSLNRIETIAELFERWMFDPATGAVIEDFNSDWSRLGEARVEPGHCYEWAFLLAEVERLTGRDTASWRRRLVDYAERAGVSAGLVIDAIGAEPVSHRLWPQLERFRTLVHVYHPSSELSKFLEEVIELFLKPGPRHGWIDKLDASRAWDVSAVPASMLYHLMTALAPIARAPR
ncbi:AGE family epimerase/isomerase [Hyphobacterium vulgare]|uniref:AGE family epimerase/isomerase n=1 Tax=Hyphobacterium vulgare TaxID=1736751 RepID=A0ABV6ZVG9_9PROT